MDNFMIRMFQPRAQKRELTATTQEQETTSQTTPSASYENRQVWIGGQQSALTVSAYHRALELRSRTFSQLVPEIQKRSSETGGNFVADNYGVNRRLNRLLQLRPNPLMSASVLLTNLELQRIQCGNGVVYLQRDGFGDIQSIWLCTTASLDVVTNEYVITYRTIGGIITKRVSADDVIHLRNTFSYDGGLTGIPTLMYMRDVLSLDATNRKLQTENAAKGGRLRLLLTQGQPGQSVGLVGKFSRSQMASAKDQLQQAMSDDVIVQPYGTEAKPIQMTATEMDILSTRKFTVDEISRFTGVPRFLLGDATGSTYRTADQALQELLKFTMQPIVNEFEQEASYKMLAEGDWGYRKVHLCEHNLLRLDPMEQAKLNEKLIGLGVKTINEVRRDYDQPSIGGGDRPFITVQAQPVDSVCKPAQQVEQKRAEKGGEK